MKEHGAVYLNAIGGAAQFYARTIKSVDGVSLMEFGTPEAMWHLTIEGFPAIVTMDAHGDSLHKEIEARSSQELAAIGLNELLKFMEIRRLGRAWQPLAGAVAAAYNFSIGSGGSVHRGARPGANQMINVSPTAATKISELLVEEGKAGSGLRVFVQGGGCSGFQYGLMIEEGGGEADQVFESNGVRLFVDPGQHQLPQGCRGRFRRHRDRRRLHHQESERDVDLRLRLVIQRVGARPSPCRLLIPISAG